MVMADLADFLTEYQRSVEAFITGDPEPQKRLWSRADDAVLANPLVPVAQGWEAIARVLDETAALLHDGTASAVERIAGFATPDLAYTVVIEHDLVRIGDAAAAAESTLRVTSIFRREADGWKVVHRHADPITSVRPPETLIGR
jgi:ketosteroid isomerase-like protein